MSAPSYAVFDRHGNVLSETVRDSHGGARDAACAAARRADATYWMPSGRDWTWPDLEVQGCRVEAVKIEARR